DGNRWYWRAVIESRGEQRSHCGVRRCRKMTSVRQCDRRVVCFNTCVSGLHLEQVECWIVLTSRVVLRESAENMVMKIGRVYAVSTVVARVANGRPNAE